MKLNKRDNFIGKVFNSNKHGEFIVREYHDANNIVIEFLSTGFIKNTRSKELLKGNIKDNSFDIKTGDIFQSNSYGKYEVIEYTDAKNIRIRFIDTGFERVSQIKEVRNGCIRDEYVERLVCGFGVNDANYNVYTYSEDGKQEVCPIYKDWINILIRGAGDVEKRRDAYKDVTVSEDFKYFMDYRKWVLEEQPNKDWINCQPDKDLLSSAVKIYSKETTAYISLTTNQFLKTRDNDRGDYMLGVVPSGKKYEANISFEGKREYLGVFPTELEAHKAWQAKKHEYACLLAEREVDHRVKAALCQRYAPEKDWTKT